MLRKLFLTVVVVISSAVLSSAQDQPRDQPSPECIAAFSATFQNAEDTSCAEAYGAAFTGTTTDQQIMMLCDSGQQCNSMIENVINLCGSTVSKAIHTVAEYILIYSHACARVHELSCQHHSLAMQIDHMLQARSRDECRVWPAVTSCM